jgi:Tol biopolymer transport system component
MTGPAEELWSSSQNLGYARLSKDGSSVVATRRFGMGLNEDIVVAKPNGSAMRFLTDDPDLDRWPCFSPDGTRVAFYSTRSGGKSQIFEIRVDGSGLRQLPMPGHEAYYPLYSPDGTRLEAVDERGSSYLIDLAKPDAKWTSLHAAVAGEPLTNTISSWSRDGRWLAGDLVDQGFRPIGLFVQSAETGERRRLTDFGYLPVWLSDSRRLLYFREGAIWILDTSSGRTSMILPAPRPPRSLDFFDLSSDETFLLLTEAVSQSDIWLRTEE